MRSLGCALLLALSLSACNDDNASRDLGAPPDASARTCLKNSDCPTGQFCMPPCSCAIDDMGHRCDVFVYSCTPTLQGLPCHVDGDHVVCCQ